MTKQPKESDQLPEEGPAEQVHDREGGGSKDRKRSPGVPGEEGTATGNRDAAGAEEGEDRD